MPTPGAHRKEMIRNMTSWQKKYPPYEGEEPYLYFAFADGDAQKVWRVMKVLLNRGCRVWYCTGPAGSSRELLRRQERACGAALTLLYLTDALESDKDSKTRIMVNQKDHKAILCLDTDRKNHNLAMDIHESTPSIPLYRLKKDEELETELIRAEGFTQNMLGKPATIRSGWMGKLTGALLLLTVLLTAGCVLYFQKAPTYADTLPFADPVIREAARAAAGGGALTEDSVSQIQTIRLKELPDSWEDLTILTDLQSVVLPQEAVMTGAELPEGSFRIVLSGGAS